MKLLDIRYDRLDQINEGSLRGNSFDKVINLFKIIYLLK